MKTFPSLGSLVNFKFTITNRDARFLKYKLVNDTETKELCYQNKSRRTTETPTIILLVVYLPTLIT